MAAKIVETLRTYFQDPCHKRQLTLPKLQKLIEIIDAIRPQISEIPLQEVNQFETHLIEIKFYAWRVISDVDRKGFDSKVEGMIEEIEVFKETMLRKYLAEKNFDALYALAKDVPIHLLLQCINSIPELKEYIVQTEGQWLELLNDQLFKTTIPLELISKRMAQDQPIKIILDQLKTYFKALNPVQICTDCFELLGRLIVIKDLKHGDEDLREFCRETLEYFLDHIDLQFSNKFKEMQNEEENQVLFRKALQMSVTMDQILYFQQLFLDDEPRLEKLKSLRHEILKRGLEITQNYEEPTLTKLIGIFMAFIEFKKPYEEQQYLVFPPLEREYWSDISPEILLPFLEYWMDDCQPIDEVNRRIMTEFLGVSTYPEIGAKLSSFIETLPQIYKDKGFIRLVDKDVKFDPNDISTQIVSDWTTISTDELKAMKEKLKDRIGENEVAILIRLIEIELLYRDDIEFLMKFDYWDFKIAELNSQARLHVLDCIVDKMPVNKHEFVRETAQTHFNSKNLADQLAHLNNPLTLKLVLEGFKTFEADSPRELGQHLRSIYAAEKAVDNPAMKEELKLYRHAMLQRQAKLAPSEVATFLGLDDGVYSFWFNADIEVVAPLLEGLKGYKPENKIEFTEILFQILDHPDLSEDVHGCLNMIAISLLE